jgi:hypothetical protein
VKRTFKRDVTTQVGVFENKAWDEGQRPEEAETLVSYKREGLYTLCRASSSGDDDVDDSFISFIHDPSIHHSPSVLRT